jgi:hypothetical protein
MIRETSGYSAHREVVNLKLCAIQSFKIYNNRPVVYGVNFVCIVMAVINLYELKATNSGYAADAASGLHERVAS